MKFVVVLFSIVSMALIVTGQPSKFFLTATGDHTSDSTSAVDYVLINKIDDTAYMATEHTIRNELVVSGLYRDNTLLTPNGKLYYYRADFGKQNRDTYLEQSGYFVNGVKQGPWTDYGSNGKKHYSNFY